MSTPGIPLTEWLLTHSSTVSLYHLATQSEFLRLAGTGNLPLEHLSRWLSQDRLYTQAYIRFAGGLVSRIHLPTVPPSSGTLEWRIVKILQVALDGVLRETAFFEEMAKEYGLDLVPRIGEGGTSSSSSSGGGQKVGPNEATKRYITAFETYGSTNTGIGIESTRPTKSLLEAMTLLWATEKVYLDAWMYAKHQQQPQSPDPPTTTTSSKDFDGGALRKNFIPNWTSDEFVQFVSGIEECLNELAEKDQESREKIEEQALAVWKEVLEVEKDFWPMV